MPTNQKPSRVVPIVVGIVLPTLILLFVLISVLTSQFILGGLGGNGLGGEIQSGTSTTTIVLGLAGLIWLVAGIIWTVKTKR